MSSSKLAYYSQEAFSLINLSEGTVHLLVVHVPLDHLNIISGWWCKPLFSSYTLLW